MNHIKKKKKTFLKCALKPEGLLRKTNNKQNILYGTSFATCKEEESLG